MTANGIFQGVLFLAVLAVCVKPLGLYMAESVGRWNVFGIGCAALIPRHR